jgi:hypothetical protein
MCVKHGCSTRRTGMQQPEASEVPSPAALCMARSRLRCALCVACMHEQTFRACGGQVESNIHGIGSKLTDYTVPHSLPFTIRPLGAQYSTARSHLAAHAFKNTSGCAPSGVSCRLNFWIAVCRACLPAWRVCACELSKASAHIISSKLAACGSSEHHAGQLRSAPPPHQIKQAEHHNGFQQQGMLRYNMGTACVSHSGDEHEKAQAVVRRASIATAFRNTCNVMDIDEQSQCTASGQDILRPRSRTPLDLQPQASQDLLQSQFSQEFFSTPVDQQIHVDHDMSGNNSGSMVNVSPRRLGKRPRPPQLGRLGLPP